MTAQIIDGKAIAAGIKSSIKQEVDAVLAGGNRPPCLSVVLVGNDPASKIYVSHKEKACHQAGIQSKTIFLPQDVEQQTLNRQIRELNQDSSIDGILLQLPLPDHLDKNIALDEISPEKDVDGLTPTNQGLLVANRAGLFPCTPLGCMELIRSTGIDIAGKFAAVIGRSLLVGTPLRNMLISSNATCVAMHTKTKNPRSIAKMADILVVAAGRAQLIDESWVKKDAVVIDVGIHREANKLVGDVDFEAVKEVASHITPVPGGVGPMTIAMLLGNCLKAYKAKVIDRQPLRGYRETPKSPLIVSP